MIKYGNISVSSGFVGIFSQVYVDSQENFRANLQIEESLQQMTNAMNALV